MRPFFRKTDKWMANAVFWIHFAVGIMSYVSVFLLVAGSLNLLWSADQLSFWTRGMLYGLTFFAGMYGVNHVTNDEGFCFLTSLENYFRQRANMPEVGRFTPRFYEVFRKAITSLKFWS